MSKPILERLGGRKFVLSAMVSIMAFVLAMKARLVAEFVTVATVAVGAFAASNAFITGKGTERKDGEK